MRVQTRMTKGSRSASQHGSDLAVDPGDAELGPEESRGGPTTYGRPVVTRVELDTEQMTPKKRGLCRAHRHHQPCPRSG